jgi:hypothetical protein
MALMKSGLKRSSLQMNPTWCGLTASVLRIVRSDRLASLAVLGHAGKSYKRNALEEMTFERESRLTRVDDSAAPGLVTASYRLLAVDSGTVSMQPGFLCDPPKISARGITSAN